MKACDKVIEARRHVSEQLKRFPRALLATANRRARAGSMTSYQIKEWHSNWICQYGVFTQPLRFSAIHP